MPIFGKEDEKYHAYEIGKGKDLWKRLRDAAKLPFVTKDDEQKADNKNFIEGDRMWGERKKKFTVSCTPTRKRKRKHRDKSHRKNREAFREICKDMKVSALTYAFRRMMFFKQHWKYFCPFLGKEDETVEGPLFREACRRASVDYDKVMQMSDDIEILHTGTWMDPGAFSVKRIENGDRLCRHLTLRRYQVDGVKWLIRQHEQGIGGILGDEMGLGKTVQVCVFLEALKRRQLQMREIKQIGTQQSKIKKSEEKVMKESGKFEMDIKEEDDEHETHLIISPLSVLDGWKKECSIWAPSLKCCVYYGSASERRITAKKIKQSMQPINERNRKMRFSEKAKKVKRIIKEDEEEDEFENESSYENCDETYEKEDENEDEEDESEFNSKNESAEIGIDEEEITELRAKKKRSSKPSHTISLRNTRKRRIVDYDSEDSTDYSPKFHKEFRFEKSNRHYISRQEQSFHSFLHQSDDDRIDVVITTYDIVMNSVSWMSKLKWGYIILDECQRAKLETGIIGKAIRNFQTLKRLLIVGTPLQNNTHELWSFLNFLYPEILSNPEVFDRGASTKAIRSIKDTIPYQASTPAFGTYYDSLSLYLQESTPSACSYPCTPLITTSSLSRLHSPPHFSTFTSLSFYQSSPGPHSRLQRMNSSKESFPSDNFNTDQFASSDQMTSPISKSSSNIIFKPSPQYGSIDTESDVTSSVPFDINVISAAHRLLRCVMLRRLKRDVAHLPPKVEIKVSVPLSRIQVILYHKLISERCKRNMYLHCARSPQRATKLLHEEDNMLTDLKDPEAEESEWNYYKKKVFEANKEHSPFQKVSAKRSASVSPFPSFISSPGLESLNDQKSCFQMDPSSIEILKDENEEAGLPFSLDRTSLANLFVSLQKCCNHPFLLLDDEQIDCRSGSDFVDSVIKASGKMRVLDEMLQRIAKENERIAKQYKNSLSTCNINESLSNSVDSSLLDSEEINHEQFASFPSSSACVPHKVIIFTHSKSVMQLLSQCFTQRKWRHLLLDGTTPRARRVYECSLFSQPYSSPWIYIVSTRAGGVGLNLQAADTVFLFDSDWNPTVDKQAMDRSHRIGQTRPVRVFRLVARGTCEERVLQLAKRKDLMSELVLRDERKAVGWEDDKEAKKLDEYEDFDENSERMNAESLEKQTLLSILNFGLNEITFKDRSSIDTDISEESVKRIVDECFKSAHLSIENNLKKKEINSESLPINKMQNLEKTPIDFLSPISSPSFEFPTKRIQNSDFSIIQRIESSFRPKIDLENFSPQTSNTGVATEIDTLLDATRTPQKISSFHVSSSSSNMLLNLSTNSKELSQIPPSLSPSHVSSSLSPSPSISILRSRSISNCLYSDSSDISPSSSPAPSPSVSPSLSPSLQSSHLASLFSEIVNSIDKSPKCQQESSIPHMQRGQDNSQMLPAFQAESQKIEKNCNSSFCISDYSSKSDNESPEVLESTQADSALNKKVPEKYRAARNRTLTTMKQIPFVGKVPVSNWSIQAEMEEKAIKKSKKTLKQTEANDSIPKIQHLSICVICRRKLTEQPPDEEDLLLKLSSHTSINVMLPELMECFFDVLAVAFLFVVAVYTVALLQLNAWNILKG
ncbi:putative SNF2 superfamily family [Monocercomonoides exilis]|uniref:putative SNF2 superfamily family n=1 Tax=Monocercomonoides exilis TaxID=2049356 RepID=UPI003559B6DD|nr:putative SNF2 super family [Monocercomonoides exilis]|eukprot:MONOS_2579.1-p1 / transcript=MONOS_2579.1 / gene=MONOS_2579 / organism=Monocercomonoides_exilis_PA203 / gene_product=SNF2 super family / transcript_product=SNF2 super family / location=Mono_scaffold00054:48144-53289(+) / protein_length=1598 / sequence_SO=supercontig / SO=protein_coding / is_pseudo=false